MVRYFFGLVLVIAGLMMSPLGASSASAWSETNPTPQIKLALQSAMAAFIDNASDADGGFRYIDRSSGAVRTAYPGAMHPKIIPLGHDYFLCIEMLDATGAVKLVDFLLRQTAAGWLLMSSLIGVIWLKKRWPAWGRPLWLGWGPSCP